MRARYGRQGEELEILGRLAGINDPADWVMRQSLVRLNFTCMIFERTRAFNSTTRFELLYDATPIMSVEVLVVREFQLKFSALGEPPQIRSTICPMVTLGHLHCSAADKAMAVLHSWWLLRGPSEQSMDKLRKLVINCPTDTGPERQVALARNVLPCLFGKPADAESRLFPNAIKWQAWSHLWDNVVKHVVL